MHKDNKSKLYMKWKGIFVLQSNVLEFTQTRNINKNNSYTQTIQFRLLLRYVHTRTVGQITNYESGGLKPVIVFHFEG